MGNLTPNLDAENVPEARSIAVSRVYGTLLPYRQPKTALF
jgi:hypothetical protein